MKRIFTKKKAYVFTIIGITQFFIFPIIAMFFYPGGTREDSTINGYSFFQNMFSDLGMRYAYSGMSNLVSMWLFSISMGLVGVSIIVFVFAFYSTLNIAEKKNYISRIASIFGVIAGFCFIIVGFTPKDLEWAYISHFLFQYIAFLAIILMGILYSIDIFKDRALLPIYGFVFIGCAFVGLIYLLILYKIIPVSLIVDVTAQKLVVYVQILTFLIQSYGGLKKEIIQLE